MEIFLKTTQEFNIETTAFENLRRIRIGNDYLYFTKDNKIIFLNYLSNKITLKMAITMLEKHYGN